MKSNSTMNITITLKNDRNKNYKIKEKRNNSRLIIYQMEKTLLNDKNKNYMIRRETMVKRRKMIR